MFIRKCLPKSFASPWRSSKKRIRKNNKVNTPYKNYFEQKSKQLNLNVFPFYFTSNIFHGLITQWKIPILQWSSCPNLSIPSTRRTLGIYTAMLCVVLYNTVGPASALNMYCFVGLIELVCGPKFSPWARVWQKCCRLLQK